jgi:hypothetical protein
MQIPKYGLSIIALSLTMSCSKEVDTNQQLVVLDDRVLYKEMYFKDKDVLLLEVNKSPEPPAILLTPCSSQEMSHMANKVLHTGQIGSIFYIGSSSDNLVDCEELKQKYSKEDISTTGRPDV